jgi:hypothetical protein
MVGIAKLGSDQKSVPFFLGADHEYLPLFKNINQAGQTFPSPMICSARKGVHWVLKIIRDRPRLISPVNRGLSPDAYGLLVVGSVAVSLAATPEPVFARGKARDAKFGRPNEPSSNTASRKNWPDP